MLRVFSRFLLAGLLAVLPLSRVWSQDSTALAAGSRVRWMAQGEDRWQVGSLVKAHHDTLWVRADSNVSLKFLEEDLRGFDLSRGTASRGRDAWKGARWGLGAGIVGAAVGAVASGCQYGSFNAFNARASNNRNCIGVGGVAAFVAGGTAIGALIGWISPPAEDWRKVPLSGPNAALTLLPLGLAITF